MLLLLACASSSPIRADTSGVDATSETIPAVPGCDPGAPTAYVTEGDEVTVTVGCTGQGTADAFDVPTPPDGATWDPETRTLTWTPGLDQAGRHDVPVVSDGVFRETGTLRIDVADAWDAPANVPVDPLTYTEELGLPVFHLTRPPDTNADTDVDASLVYEGHTYAIRLKYRGASSLYYPKNSYTITFPTDDHFEDADEGFDNRRKIVLTTTFDDNSYVRQALCYELWSALDPSRQQIQTMFAPVYINGAYEGLYVVTDHIDGEYWKDNGYTEDADLYKAITHEANFYADYSGAHKATWHDGYTKEEGPDGDWADLDAFVQWAATASDDDFRAGLGDRFAMNELIDWWILVRFTEADDSGGKNAYLYFDPVGGLIHHAPWDFNHSFGQTWQTEREASDTDYDFYWSNNLFARSLEDPELGPIWRARMRAALDGPLADEAVQARIDAHIARIGLSAARDWDKWQDAYRSYGGWNWRTDWTSYEDEVAYVKEWTSERDAVMNGWY
jgi:hypothetical protein